MTDGHGAECGDVVAKRPRIPPNAMESQVRVCSLEHRQCKRSGVCQTDRHRGVLRFSGACVRSGYLNRLSVVLRNARR